MSFGCDFETVDAGTQVGNSVAEKHVSWCSSVNPDWWSWAVFAKSHHYWFNSSWKNLMGFADLISNEGRSSEEGEGGSPQMREQQ